MPPFEQSPQKKELRELSPEEIRNHFEANRISSDASFAPIYSTYQDDMDRVQRMKESHEKGEHDEIGFFGEALISSCIENGALGSSITARGTNPYDDFLHGADVVVETTSKQQRDPVVASVDITVSQQAPGTQARSSFESGGVVYKNGLESKIARIKKHIEFVASIPRQDAIDISAWLQSGGLSQKRTRENEHFFDIAEKIMLLKYYKNPSTSEEPNKPHYVLAGPQIALSIDRSFVNKVFTGTQKDKALNDINALIQVQTPMAVTLITQYVEDLARTLSKKGQAPNLFFDMTRAACKAWELTFDTEQNKMRIERAVKQCLTDPELKKQVQTYQGALVKGFSL